MFDKDETQTYQASSPKARIPRHTRLLIHCDALATKLLYSDANQRAQKSTNGGDELRSHGRALREARLHQQRKVAHFVGNFVEKDGNSCCCANGWAGVEAGRHGEAVGDIVRKVGTVKDTLLDDFCKTPKSSKRNESFPPKANEREAKSPRLT
jgi:hypothetical protein